MSDAENSESPQAKVMQEWGQGFVQRDLDLITKHMHKDYRHITYPQSLGIPEQSREDYLGHMGKVMSFWKSNDATVHSIIDAQVKVVAHVTSIIKTAIEVDVTRESIYIAQIIVDEDGSLKIKQMEEFTDSKSHLDMVQAVKAATSNKD